MKQTTSGLVAAHQFENSQIEVFAEHHTAAFRLESAEKRPREIDDGTLRIVNTYGYKNLDYQSGKVREKKHIY